MFSFRELMELMLGEIGKRRFLAPLPWPLARPAGRGRRPRRAAHRAADHRRPGDPAEGRQCGERRLSGPGRAGRHADHAGGGAATYLYRYRKGGQYADQEDRELAAI